MRMQMLCCTLSPHSRPSLTIPKEKKKRNLNTHKKYEHTKHTFTQSVIKLTFSYFHQNFLPFQHTSNSDTFFPLYHKHWFWCTVRSLNTILLLTLTKTIFEHSYRCLEFSQELCKRTKRIVVYYGRRIENEHTFHPSSSFSTTIFHFCFRFFSTRSTL